MSNEKKSTVIFRRLFGKTKSAKQDNVQHKSSFHNSSPFDDGFKIW